jgi:chromosome segregation protein
MFFPSMTPVTWSTLFGSRISSAPPSLIREIEAGDAVRTRLGAELAAAETKMAELGEAARGIEAAFAQANEALAMARESRAGAAARAENEEGAPRGNGSGFQASVSSVPPPHAARTSSNSIADQDRPWPQRGERPAMDKLVADRERLGPVNLDGCGRAG